MASAVTEMDVEARIARLEADVSHIRSDLADVKLDVRALRDRGDELADRHTDRLDALDAKFSARMDGLDAKAAARSDALEAKLTERMARLETRVDGLQRDLASARVWALLLYITLAGGMYATLARTMGWI